MKSKRFWLLPALAALLTVALGAYAVLGLTLGRRLHSGTPEAGQGIYTVQDRQAYWRGFDATALAAVVSHAFPDAHSGSLAEGGGENSLTLTVDTDAGALGLQFFLDSPGATLRQEYSGYERGFVFTSRVYQAVAAPRELALGYGEHLLALGVRLSASLEKDLDGDGDTEFVYLAEHFAESWLADLEGTPEQEKALAALRGRTVCTLLDSRGRELYVHSFCLDTPMAALTDAVWDGGFLHLLSGERVTRLMVSEAALCRRSYTEQELVQLCRRYAAYLEDRGYTDVRMQLADVSQAAGNEVVCTYTDGTDYTAQVLTPYLGRMQPMFTKTGTQGAVFLVARGSSVHLLDYSQVLSGEDYSLTYRYRVVSFDEGYNLLLWEGETLRVAADQGGGQAGSSFFGKVNSLLELSQVCYDPYSLTGYTLMQGGLQTVTGEGRRYLNITNCSTNKVGIVTLSHDDSWLNLRSGPSTEHGTVLIDPENEESRVKQVQGSLVTVIMPYNTGNRANPVWSRIGITYQNERLEGYSSQKFIHIEGIRHLTPGQQFTVEVDNRESPLTWASSDPKVLSVDAQTGTVTAHKSGLVLISVRSEAGLEDSCLIMVD